MNATGQPDLPTKGVSIAIPSNMDATGVRIVNVEYIDLPGTYKIAPCEPPRLCGTGNPVLTMSAKQAFAEAVNFPRGIYPGELVRFGNCGWMRDYHLASVTVYPVQYDTVTGALRMYTHIEFELIMAAGSSDVPVIAARSAAGDAAFASMARSAVINPLEVKPAPAVWGAAKALAVDDANYLIITDASLVSAFQPLADWKKAKGLTTQIVTTSTIYNDNAAYPGDDPASIRACIKHYVENHGTDYVLLGGDSDFIPTRNVFVHTNACVTDGGPAPSDLYYADLDGDWNADAAGTVKSYPNDDPYFAKGSTSSGSYANCGADDGIYHVVRTGTSGSNQVVEVRYNRTIDSNSPTSLTYKFVGKASWEGTVKLSMMKWDGMVSWWEEVQSGAVGASSDTTLTFTTTGAPVSFVDSYGGGTVQFKIIYTVPSATTQYLSIDLLELSTSGDLLYCENTDNVNLVPDLLGIGRAPVNNTTEVATFINKVLQYEGAPSKPALYTDYEKTVALLAGIWDSMPGNDTAVQMDYLSNSVIPPGFTINKLYQNNDTMTYADTLSNLNSGRNIVAHAHHGNITVLTLGEGEDGLYEDQIYGLTNAPRYTGYFTTESCLSGYFDWSEGRCVGESFVLAPSGGGYYSGNSRTSYYGTGDTGLIESDAAKVLTEEFRSLFTRHTVHAGELLAGAATEIAPLGQTDFILRWCLCEKNLLGDPETPIWVNTPSAMTVNINPSSVTTGSSTSVRVTVTKSGANVPNAKVCLWKGAEVYAVGMTDSSGYVDLSVTPTTTGTIQVTATYLDDGNNTIGALLPKQSTITVTGGGEETVYPTSPFTYGQTTTNTYAKCAADDSSYHVVTTTTVSGNQQADYFYATKTAKTAPTKIVLAFNGRVSTSSTVTLYLWDYRASAWVLGTSGTVSSTSDTTLTYTGTSNVARFVLSNGEMKCRINYSAAGENPQTISVDRLRWTITQGTSENKYPTSDADTYCAYGTTTSNSYKKCAASDDSYHVVTTALLNGAIEVADFYYKTTTTKTDPTALKVTYEGKVSSSANLTLMLWDYTASAWMQVYNNPTFFTTDTSVDGVATGVLSRFVNADTGEMRCKVVCSQSGTTAWTVSTDLVKWTVTQ